MTALGSSGREARREELRAWFEEHAHGFHALEGAFRDHLGGALRAARLDDARLETRTKTLESFLDKATKSDGRGGYKYADPAGQLTDFVGARVLVPLSADVAPVARLVQRLYLVEEMSDQRADSMLDVPGYQSLHFLVRFREEDREALGLSEGGISERPVEVQIRSILQHAWAALQHDLMYKGERAPTDHVRRRLIALAGLLELADQEFMSVRLAHGDAAGMLDDAHAGGFDVAGVRAWAELFVGDESGTEPVAWAAALRAVLSGLGATTADEATTLLGEWAGRGPELARTVRATRPWATASYVADLALRLALGADYLARREVTDLAAVDALDRECAAVRDALEGSP
jgi:ppGpp synthetase/RelA/SpoT-type nucleotidyltranferase